MSLSVHKVEHTADIADLVREAAIHKQGIEIRAGGTKAALGRPVKAALALDLAGISGVTLYEPAELVLSAKAGTSLQLVSDLLARHGQMLPFEPADYRALLQSAGEATIGGMVATNLSGPRRLYAGACRDAVIGCKFINGRGEEITSGGRVMKNVTGYDIGRAMAGAYGTLGVLTEVTFKVLPRSQTALTLLYEGLEEEEALALLRKAAASPFEVTGAAHVPGAPARTCLRLEGFEASISYRAGRLEEDLAEYGLPRRLDEPATLKLWEEIAAVQPLCGDAAIIWRLMTPPTEAAKLVALLRREIEAGALYDWAGGLTWLAIAGGNAHEALIRAHAKACRGHATLIRASASLRSALSPFGEPEEAVTRLASGLKKAFDPAGILNPGRMYKGL